MGQRKAEGKSIFLPFASILTLILFIDVTEKEKKKTQLELECFLEMH